MADLHKSRSSHANKQDIQELHSSRTVFAVLYPMLSFSRLQLLADRLHRYVLINNLTSVHSQEQSFLLQQIQHQLSVRVDQSRGA